MYSLTYSKFLGFITVFLRASLFFSTKWENQRKLQVLNKCQKFRHVLIYKYFVHNFADFQQKFFHLFKFQFNLQNVQKMFLIFLAKYCTKDVRWNRLKAILHHVKQCTTDTVSVSVSADISVLLIREMSYRYHYWYRLIQISISVANR